MNTTTKTWITQHESKYKGHKLQKKVHPHLCLPSALDGLILPTTKKCSVLHSVSDHYTSVSASADWSVSLDIKKFPNIHSSNNRKNNNWHPNNHIIRHHLFSAQSGVWMILLYSTNLPLLRHLQAFRDHTPSDIKFSHCSPWTWLESLITTEVLDALTCQQRYTWQWSCHHGDRSDLQGMPTSS